MDNKKITKIWYLIIAILVVFAGLIYVFKGDIFKHTNPVQPTEPVEIQEQSNPVEDVTKQPAGQDVQKEVVKKEVKKVETTVEQKQEVKPNIQKEIPVKKTEPISVNTEQKTTEPEAEIGTTTIQQTSKTVTQNGGTSEVVEIRYMYKSNPNENVLYRGVWYNIKTKTLDENGNEITPNTATTENESK